MAVLPGRVHLAKTSPRRTHTKPSAVAQANVNVPPSSQLNPAASSWSFSGLEATTAHNDIPVSTLSSMSRSSAQPVQQVRRPVFGEETPSPEPTSVLPSSLARPINTARPPPSQPSVSKRGCVVVDLDSDEEDILSTPTLPTKIRPTPAHPSPACLPPVAQVAVSPSQTIPPPSIPPAHAPPTKNPPSPARHSLIASNVPTPVRCIPASSIPTPTITKPAPLETVSPALEARQAIAAARLKHFEKKVHETIDLTLDD
jgi:hypothetical protein